MSNLQKKFETSSSVTEVNSYHTIVFFPQFAVIVMSCDSPDIMPIDPHKKN